MACRLFGIIDKDQNYDFFPAEQEVCLLTYNKPGDVLFTQTKLDAKL